MNENLKEKEKGLQDEINDFKAERDNIRKIIGGIGGVPTPKARLVNIVFITLVLIVFGLSLVWGGRIRFFMIELGILLLSVFSRILRSP